MTLRQKQSRFACMIARLILWANEHGYEVTLGEAWRPQETADLYASQGRGSARSLHCSRLAVDLNLFKDGRYLSSTESHRPLGEQWERMGGAWGGRFKDSQGRPKPDGNHYSVGHRGMK